MRSLGQEYYLAIKTLHMTHEMVSLAGFAIQRRLLKTNI